MASPEVRGVGQNLDYIEYVWVSKALRSTDFIISKMRNHWRVLSREMFKKHPSSSVILHCGLYFASKGTFGNLQTFSFATAGGDGVCYWH